MIYRTLWKREVYKLGIVLADRSLPRTGAEELAAGSDLSAGAEDGGVVDFVRSVKAKPFAWAMIERGSDLVAAGLGEIGERGLILDALTFIDDRDLRTCRWNRY